MTKVAIIGGGEIGKAVEGVCMPESVLGIFDHEASRSTIASPELLAEADIIFLCVPSQFIRSAITENVQHFKSDAIVVALTKGIERGTNKLISEIITELLPAHSWGLISGPMIAEEIMTGKVAAGFLASTSKQVYDSVMIVLNQQRIKLHYTDEVASVALLAATKNIYAIGLGILSGLGVGSNAQSYLVVQALEEMTSILEQEGTPTNLVYDLPGLGDLLATGYSAGSKNRAVGEALAKSAEAPISEGVHALVGLQARLGTQTSSLPLFTRLYQIVINKVNPTTLLNALFHD